MHRGAVTGHRVSSNVHSRSCYLIYKGQTWGNYETFATMTGGGSAATQIANKLINSKFNSSPGEVGKKIGDGK